MSCHVPDGGEKMYYLFSLLSGSAEIGFLLWAISAGLSPVWVGGIGIAYQLGNLIPIPYQPSKADQRVGMILAGGIFSVLLCMEDIRKFPIIVCILAGLSSAEIQCIRTACNSHGVRWKKRLCRVSGFLTALLYPDNFLLCLEILWIFLAYGIYRTEKRKRRFVVPRGSRTMIFHQIHYFSYAYMMLYLSCNLQENFIVTILSFVISWLTYLVVEPILKRYGKGNYKKYLSIGHMWLAISLLLIPFSYRHGNVWFYILWWLSGFGGGTVFCIRYVEEEKMGTEIASDSWQWSENLGHVLGCLFLLLWVCIEPIEWIPFLGAEFALLTIFSALRGRKNENL